MTDYPYITDEAVNAAWRVWEKSNTKDDFDCIHDELTAALPHIEPAIRADERAKTHLRFQPLARLMREWTEAQDGVLTAQQVREVIRQIVRRSATGDPS